LFLESFNVLLLLSPLFPISMKFPIARVSKC